MGIYRVLHNDFIINEILWFLHASYNAGTNEDVYQITAIISGFERVNGLQETGAKSTLENGNTVPFRKIEVIPDHATRGTSFDIDLACPNEFAQ